MEWYIHTWSEYLPIKQKKSYKNWWTSKNWDFGSVDGDIEQRCSSSVVSVGFFLILQTSTWLLWIGEDGCLSNQTSHLPEIDALIAVVEQINVSLQDRKTKTMSSCSTTMQTPSVDMTAMGVMGDTVNMYWFESWQLLVALWCVWKRAAKSSDQCWSNVSWIWNVTFPSSNKSSIALIWQDK